MVRIVLFLTCLAASAALAQEPEARDEPPAEPVPIDVDTAISGILARMLAIPRFEEEVEVRDRYQEALDAYLAANALECEAPTSEGPPTAAELDRYGANPKPPSVDLVAAGKLLWGKGKGAGKPRFYLYAVRREDAPEHVVYVVRDGAVTEDARSSIPGTTWELRKRYSDRDKAAEALSRLERGSASAESSSGPRTLWVAAGCGR
jgi:hypothetical protein